MFLGKDEFSNTNWQEWELQAYIVQEARRAGYFIEGDQNAAKRGYGAAARAKACGMQAGSPDLRILLPAGVTIWVELKKFKGKRSFNQTKWHDDAIYLGHKVYTIYADSPKEAWQKISKILEGQ